MSSITDNLVTCRWSRSLFVKLRQKSQITIIMHLHFGGARWSGGCVLDCQVRKKSEVQTPTRAEIWIEISVPCAPLIRLLDHASVDTRASPKPGTGVRKRGSSEWMQMRWS